MSVSDPPAITPRRRAGLFAALVLAGSVGLAAGAVAQKNSGPLLPVTPAAPAMVPQPSRPPVQRPAPPPGPRMSQTPSQGGTNPDAESLARTLPLDPQTRDLRDAAPPDRAGTERRLGLREPRGAATDMRGRTPSPREIVDALAPR